MMKYNDTKIVEALSFPAIPTSKEPIYKFPYIVKPDAGSLGIRVEKINNKGDNVKHYCNGHIYQPFIEGTDVCVSIVDSHAVAAITRIPKKGDFRANVAQGATAIPYLLNDNLKELARGISLALGARMCCLDFIKTPEGQYLFLECNRGSEFKVTSEVTGIDVAGMSKTFKDSLYKTVKHENYTLKKREFENVIPKCNWSKTKPFFIFEMKIRNSIVVLKDEDVVGYAFEFPCNIYIEQEHRNKGIGRLLLCMMGYPPASVLRNNEPTRRMLKSCGYEPLIEQKDRTIFTKGGRNARDNTAANH
jgi:hypothetical protein